MDLLQIAMIALAVGITGYVFYRAYQAFTKKSGKSFGGPSKGKNPREL